MTTITQPVTGEAQLTVGERSVVLPVVEATEGNNGLVVSSLLKETGLSTYDPGYVNTASTQSAITYIDGDQGILRYRGYPIEQLAEGSTFLEVAYLLIYGEPVLLALLLLFVPGLAGIFGTWVSVPLSQLLAMTLGIGFLFINPHKK